MRSALLLLWHASLIISSGMGSGMGTGVAGSGLEAVPGYPDCPLDFFGPDCEFQCSTMCFRTVGDGPLCYVDACGQPQCTCSDHGVFLQYPTYGLGSRCLCDPGWSGVNCSLDCTTAAPQGCSTGTPICTAPNGLTFQTCEPGAPVSTESTLSPSSRRLLTSVPTPVPTHHIQCHNGARHIAKPHNDDFFTVPTCLPPIVHAVRLVAHIPVVENAVSPYEIHRFDDPRDGLYLAFPGTADELSPSDHNTVYFTLEPTDLARRTFIVRNAYFQDRTLEILSDLVTIAGHTSYRVGFSTEKVALPAKWKFGLGMAGRIESADIPGFFLTALAANDSSAAVNHTVYASSNFYAAVVWNVAYKRSTASHPAPEWLDSPFVGGKLLDSFYVGPNMYTCSTTCNFDKECGYANYQDQRCDIFDKSSYGLAGFMVDLTNETAFGYAKEGYTRHIPHFNAVTGEITTTGVPFVPNPISDSPCFLPSAAPLCKRVREGPFYMKVALSSGPSWFYGKDINPTDHGYTFDMGPSDSMFLQNISVSTSLRKFYFEHIDFSNEVYVFLFGTNLTLAAMIDGAAPVPAGCPTCTTYVTFFREYDATTAQPWVIHWLDDAHTQLRLSLGLRDQAPIPTGTDGQAFPDDNDGHDSPAPLFLTHRNPTGFSLALPLSDTNLAQPAPYYYVGLEIQGGATNTQSMQQIITLQREAQTIENPKLIGYQMSYASNDTVLVDSFQPVFGENQCYSMCMQTSTCRSYEYKNATVGGTTPDASSCTLFRQGALKVLYSFAIPPSFNPANPQQRAEILKAEASLTYSRAHIGVWFKNRVLDDATYYDDIASSNPDQLIKVTNAMVTAPFYKQQLGGRPPVPFYDALPASRRIWTRMKEEMGPVRLRSYISATTPARWISRANVDGMTYTPEDSGSAQHAYFVFEPCDGIKDCYTIHSALDAALVLHVNLTKSIQIEDTFVRFRRDNTYNRETHSPDRWRLIWANTNTHTQFYIEHYGLTGWFLSIDIRTENAPITIKTWDDPYSLARDHANLLWNWEFPTAQDLVIPAAGATSGPGSNDPLFTVGLQSVQSGVMFSDGWTPLANPSYTDKLRETVGANYRPTVWPDVVLNLPVPTWNVQFDSIDKARALCAQMQGCQGGFETSPLLTAGSLGSGNVTFVSSWVPESALHPYTPKIRKGSSDPKHFNLFVMRQRRHCLIPYLNDDCANPIIGPVALIAASSQFGDQDLALTFNHTSATHADDEAVNQFILYGHSEDPSKLSKFGFHREFYLRKIGYQNWEILVNEQGTPVFSTTYNSAADGGLAAFFGNSSFVAYDPDAHAFMRLLPFDDSGYVDTFIMEDSLYAMDTDASDEREELEDVSFRIRHDHLHSINPNLYLGIDTDTTDADLYDVGLFKEAALVDVVDDLIQNDWELHFHDDNPIYPLTDTIDDRGFLTSHQLAFPAPNDGINVFPLTATTVGVSAASLCTVGALELTLGTAASGTGSATTGSTVDDSEAGFQLAQFVSAVGEFTSRFNPEQSGISSAFSEIEGHVDSTTQEAVDQQAFISTSSAWITLNVLPAGISGVRAPVCIPPGNTASAREWTGIQVPHLDLFPASSDLECASRCDADLRCLAMKMFTATDAQLALGYNHICKLYSSARLVSAAVPDAQTKAYVVTGTKTGSDTQAWVGRWNIRRKDWPIKTNSVLQVHFHQTGYLNTYIASIEGIPGITAVLDNFNYALLALDHVSKCVLSDGRVCTSLDRARYPPADVEVAIVSADDTNGGSKTGPYDHNTVTIEPYWTVVHRGSNASQVVIFQSDLSAMIAATIKSNGDDPDLTYGGADLVPLLKSSATGFAAQDTRAQLISDSMVNEVFNGLGRFLQGPVEISSSKDPIDLSQFNAALDFSHQPNPWRGQFLAYDEHFDAWMILQSFDPERCWLSLDKP